jgi:hypothetical protein
MRLGFFFFTYGCMEKGTAREGANNLNNNNLTNIKSVCRFLYIIQML